MWIYYTLTKEKEGNNKNWRKNKQNRKINVYINKYLMNQFNKSIKH